MEQEDSSPLDCIAIPEPCPMAKELARGGQADRRYCDQCEKHVVNLSALEKQAAEDEIRSAQAAGRRLCVRIIRDQETGKVLTRDDLPRLTARLAKHRPPKVAAALAFAVLQWSCAGEDSSQRENKGTKPPVLHGHSPVIPDQYRPGYSQPEVGEITTTVGETMDPELSADALEQPRTVDEIYLLQQLGGYIDE